MLLSTEPLHKRFLERAGLHHIAAWIFLVLLAIGHLAILPYHLRLLAGATVMARVARLEYYATTNSDGDKIHHHRVHTALPGGYPFSDEVEHRVFVSLAVGDPVPVRLCPLIPSYFSNIGPRPHLYWLVAWLGGTVVALMLCGYAVAVSRRRWYEGPVTDSGTGRLQESLDSGRETVDGK